MNKRLLIVLFVAALVSGAASLVLYRMIAGRGNKPVETTKVVIATKNLRIGALIREEDVQAADWPGTIPAGAFQDPKLVVNRGVVQSILAGEPLVEARLAKKGAGGGLAATIPPGKRAVAIRVNDVTSLAGFVVPGMKVDILMSAKPPREAMDEDTERSLGSGSITKTILQNIEVLSAGTNIEPNAEGKPISVTVINLLVTPEESEVLSLASNEGRVQLVLRNPTDEKVTSTPGTAMGKLLFPESFEKKKVPAPVPAKIRPKPQTARWEPRIQVEPQVQAPPPFTVEVIHGNKKTETAFERPSGGTK